MRGGLRTRLIADSVRVCAIAGLTQLGWFDATVHDTPPGARQHRPVRYVPRPEPWHAEIVPNCIAITTEDISDRDSGLGGEVADTIRLYVDVFAENDTVGWQLAVDTRDILLGKISTFDRHAPVLDVYDLRMATPAAFTQVDLEDLRVDRADGTARSWYAHWFMVRVNAYDEYLDEAGAIADLGLWDLDLDSAWQLIQSIGSA